MVRGSESAWFRLVVRTAGLAGGFNYRQAYDHAGACAVCGAGAIPVGPLVAELSRMGRKLLDRTAHDGHLVVTAGLADTLVGAGVTGVEVRPVRRPHRDVPDPGYRWLHVVFTWPAMASRSMVTTDDLCPRCRRTGYFDVGREAGEWRYAEPPVPPADFGYTWERFGYWRAAAWEPGLRGVGGAGEVIVSSRARALLAACGVRHVEYLPVVFEPHGR
jgi:hypothetical protein